MPVNVNSGGSQTAIKSIVTTRTPDDVATSKTFHFIGAAQLFEVPAGITSIHVEAGGAQGGIGTGGNGTGLPTVGGLGHEFEFDLPVTPGEILQINVGGMGVAGAAGGFAGFNGGGAGFLNRSGAGGDATDIRQGGTSTSDRVAVAAGGGGGGSGDYSSTPRNRPGGNGGDAGGIGAAAVSSGGVGGNPGTLGAGGTGTAGNDGTASTGGAYATGTTNAGYGGGGGGGYGGGEGGQGGPGSSSNNSGGGGGGGGFSLVPVGGTTPTATRAGHGYAVLSW